MNSDHKKTGMVKIRWLGCLTVIAVAFVLFSLTKAKDIYTTGSIKKIMSSSHSSKSADKLFKQCSEKGLDTGQSIKELIEKQGEIVGTRYLIKEVPQELTLRGKVLLTKEKYVVTTYELKGCIADFPEERLELNIAYKAVERKFLYFRSARLLVSHFVIISTPLLGESIQLNAKEFAPTLLLRGAEYINSIITKSRIIVSGATKEIKLKASQTADSTTLLGTACNYCDDETLALVMGQLEIRGAVENQKLLRKMLLDPYFLENPSQQVSHVRAINFQLMPYHPILIDKVDDPELLLDIATGSGKIDPQDRIRALNKILSQDTCIKVLHSSVHADVKLVAAKHLKDEQIIFDEIMKRSAGKIVLAQLASQLRAQDNLFSVAAEFKDVQEVEQAAVEQMDDDHLREFILKWSCRDVYNFHVSYALAQIDDPKNVTFFVSDPCEEINQQTRFVAIEILKDQRELAQIACTHPNNTIREIAVKKISSQEVLARIVLTDGSSFVREAASNQIRRLGSEKK
jgi:hypothetical protein